MDFTKHAKVRLQQRAISETMIDLVLQYGEKLSAPGGATLTVFNERAFLRVQQLIERAKNVSVIQAEDGTIITSQHQTQRLKQKPKTNLDRSKQRKERTR